MGWQAEDLVWWGDDDDEYVSMKWNSGEEIVWVEEIIVIILSYVNLYTNMATVSLIFDVMFV